MKNLIFELSKAWLSMKRIDRDEIIPGSCVIIPGYSDGMSVEEGRIHPGMVLNT